MFVYTTVANEIEKGFQGLIDRARSSSLAILVTSFWSRIARSRELRFAGFKMADPESQLLWDTIRHLELTILVPHRPGRRTLANKEAQIRREHRIPRDLMIVFVEVELADASDFVNEPVLEVDQEEGRYVMKITGAASIAHTLAAVAAGDGEGRPAAGDPLRLDGREPGERDARLPAVRRGQRAVDGPRTDPPGRAGRRRSGRSSSSPGREEIRVTTRAGR